MVVPSKVLEQIFNTAPFLREEEPRSAEEEFLKKILSFDSDSLSKIKPNSAEYFELLLNAHFLTVATFVPTDFDQAIRRKLWLSNSDPRMLESMIRAVLSAETRNGRAMSRRWVPTPSGEILSGHFGEWFSVVAAAYAVALRNPRIERALCEVLQTRIVDKLKFHARSIREILNHSDLHDANTACCLLAHNLGDFERVLVEWGIRDRDGDIVISALEETKTKPDVQWALEYNKKYSALENHRHFALRDPRPLRRKRDFLLGIGPFFCDWGRIIGETNELEEREKSEILETLVQGTLRLHKQGSYVAGYARAARGLIESTRGGMKLYRAYLPAKTLREMECGDFRKMMSEEEFDFERRWKAYFKSRRVFVQSPSPSLHFNSIALHKTE